MFGKLRKLTLIFRDGVAMLHSHVPQGHQSPFLCPYHNSCPEWGVKWLEYIASS